MARQPYIPRPEGLNAEFYGRAGEGRLHLQRCSGCGLYRHPPRHRCARCRSAEHEWVPASGRGKLFSWTVTHRAFDRGWEQEVPYATGIVELEEGVRIVGSLAREVAREIGTPVTLRLERVADDFSLINLEAAEGKVSDMQVDPAFAPLEGIRVIDFSSNIAGPYATMILAQLGADVIKVEPPQGDDARAWSLEIEGMGLVHRHVNVGKRGIVLDLKMDAGREAARRLCASADVVLQSMRPGTAERVGIGEAALRNEKPNLLYYDLSGYGAGATGSTMPGYDPMVQAHSGIVAMNGHEEMPPTRCAPSVIDLGTGQWIAMGVMAAMLARSRGKGPARMDTALIDTAFGLVPYQASEALITGRRPAKAGSGNPIVAPYQCFRARDGELLLAAPSQRLWERLVAVLERPSLLEDPRFATVRDRTRNKDDLAPLIADALADRDVDDWLERMARHGVPATRVSGLEQAVRGTIAEERRTFQPSDGVPLVRLPWIFDGAAVAWRRPAPRLGEHTQEVLGEIGYGLAEIALITAGEGSTQCPAGGNVVRKQGLNKPK